MAVTACPQWVQTRSSPTPEHRGEAGEFHEAAHTFATCSAYSSQLLPTPRHPSAPQYQSGRPTHNNTRVNGRPSSSSGIIKGLLGSLPVGPPVASDLNPHVRSYSPRRTAFDGESGQPTVARLPEAPSRDIRDNDACAFMPTPAGPYKRSARVHSTSSHARSAATPVRRHHRRWSGLLRWTADAFMLDASRDQL